MPDKPLTVLTYAASASLAAVALVYFFNPNFAIDGVKHDPKTSKKTGIVGLVNTANDCFTNSSLQVLAGLGDLRLFLIRELHRRTLSDADVYTSLPPEKDGKPINRKKILSLQSGDVTQALKTILDQLNERPLKKKTITARPFILILERAFETRISREQQDAQELLQIIAERVCDEYHAGKDARKRARKSMETNLSEASNAAGLGLTVTNEEGSVTSLRRDAQDAQDEEDNEDQDDEAGFPMEGQTQSRIVCSHCKFVPKSSPVSFVMLTLSVPQKNSATLNECFDGHFKREMIDDYKCDKCRLEHAISVYKKQLSKATSTSDQESIEQKIRKLEKALETDPEKPPKDVPLPDSKTAPSRRIERSVKITRFPQILVIHLSRSIYNVRSMSAKNMAKVSFPEHLPLGGLLDRRNYRLLGMIAHKGTHNSGHYECFRRQHVYAPYSTPHLDPELGPYGSVHTPRDTLSPRTSMQQSIQTPTEKPQDDAVDGASTATSSSQSILSRGGSTNSTTASSTSVASRRLSPTTLKPKTLERPPSSLSDDGHQSDGETVKISDESRRESTATTASRIKSNVSATGAKHRTKKVDDRWWRISDDKVKECKTHELLSMQREVYMLFYEMERSR